MHVTDPVKVLKEMKRVTKPGGVVATRDPGIGMTSLKPEREPFTRLSSEYDPAKLRFLNALGSSAQAGLHKKAWAMEAGFGEKDGGKIWEQRSYERVRPHGMNIFTGSNRDNAVELGVVAYEQIDEWAGIWDQWARLEEREALREFVDTLCFKPDGANKQKNGA